MLRRRFVRCGGRLVHLWTGGQGSALILVHASPANAWMVTPLAARLAAHYCVYAPDSPGFGLSDGLPEDPLSVAHLADAYCALMDRIGLQSAMVYGTHSGAAIGLELARRHPERVSAFVLEGVPAFTLEEQRPLLSPEYLLEFEPELLGGHYSRTWTRFHDQFIWFPWYQRLPAHLNEINAGCAEDIHLWVEMYFQAIRHEYRPAYRAIIRYGASALAAAGEVSAPGVYLCERSDMLFAHLDRLPALRAGQRIERITGAKQMPAAIEAALRALPQSPPGIVLDDTTAPGAGDPDLSFYDLPGGQILVRTAGPHEARTVLLLHDAPGAGRQLTELYWALSAHCRVILPDLPGCGESDPLAGEAPDLAAYADSLADLLAARTRGVVDIYAVGFGAALALELNARYPQRIGCLLLTGVLRSDGAAREAMLGRLAPRISLAADGSHWYRTWLMLRDSLVRWPWYAREPAALRRQTLAFLPEQLHAWTCDVMRQWHSYHHLIDAALAWDPQPALHAAHDKLAIVLDINHALFAQDAEWARASGLPSLAHPGDPADFAALLHSRQPSSD
jgi:pimeloyl-ACP methyl ester carboxylesterase